MRCIQKIFISPGVVGTFGEHGQPTFMPTIQSLLRASPLIPLEAQLLLAFVSGLTRTQLITHADQQVDPQVDAAWLNAFYALEKRRIHGEPMAYLLGYREFFGLELQVTSDVLIPRPETETLVECALATLPPTHRARVLELGTGSGAIAIALAHQRPEIEMVATDYCARALAVAIANAERLLPANRPGGKMVFALGDWYDALNTPFTESTLLPSESPQVRAYATQEATKRFDLIVSNPPYIAADDPHCTQGDLRFEPIHALTEGADGLQALYTIILGAKERLKVGGALWLEHGYNQAAAVRAALHAQGATAIRSVCDLAGIERVTGGAFAE